MNFQAAAINLSRLYYCDGICSGCSAFQRALHRKFIPVFIVQTALMSLFTILTVIPGIRKLPYSVFSANDVSIFPRSQAYLSKLKFELETHIKQAQQSSRFLSRWHPTTTTTTSTISSFVSNTSKTESWRSNMLPANRQNCKFCINQESICIKH